MKRRWIDISGDQEAAQHAGDFWSAMRTELDAGAFWADRIKRYRNEPSKRLREALEHLPLPHAFNEAAVAARALIRGKRKAARPFEEELSLLYWLAAVRSFMLDYAPRLKEPGFNVMESIPGRQVCTLPFTYKDLGYRELVLLKKTDWKWMVEVWGEPRSHTTLNAIHRRVWDTHETKLIEARERENARRLSEIRSLLS